MRTEVLKIDSKGRITIPSYVRLLLDVEEGGKILMQIDEVRGLIVLRAFHKNWSRCRGLIARHALFELLSRARVVSVSCIADLTNSDLYRCDIIVEGKEGMETALKDMRCVNDSE